MFLVGVRACEAGEPRAATPQLLGRLCGPITLALQLEEFHPSSRDGVQGLGFRV